MLAESVKSWKFLITKFTLEGDIRFWGAVIVSNIVIQMFHVECFCVDVKHRSREILRDIVYSCNLLKVLEHCVSWPHDNSNHPGTLLKNWDTGYNIRFQLSPSSCDAKVCSCNFGSKMFTSNFFFLYEARLF